MTVRYDIMEYIGNLKVISTFKTVTFSVEPTKEQIDSFAHRVAPDIKAFFNDEQIRAEFANWQQEQNTT